MRFPLRSKTYSEHVPLQLQQQPKNLAIKNNKTYLQNFSRDLRNANDVVAICLGNNIIMFHP